MRVEGRFLIAMTLKSREYSNTLLANKMGKTFPTTIFSVVQSFPFSIIWQPVHANDVEIQNNIH